MTELPYLVELPFCGSTNDELRARPKMLRQHGAAIYTLDQRQGRGRLGRRWLSPPGNLAFSAVLHAADGQCARLIPVVVGLTVFQVLKQFNPQLTLKWPNDILSHGRKLCGILCESVSGILHPPALVVIVGIGVNLQKITSMDFQAANLSLDDPTVSGREIARYLAAALQASQQPSSLTPDFIAQWNQAAGLPTQFRYGSHDKTYTGITLQSDGRLKVECEGSSILLESGEILLCSPND